MRLGLEVEPSHGIPIWGEIAIEDILQALPVVVIFKSLKLKWRLAYRSMPCVGMRAPRFHALLESWRSSHLVCYSSMRPEKWRHANYV